MLATVVEHPTTRPAPLSRPLPATRALDGDPPDQPQPGWPLLATPIPTDFPGPVDEAVECHLSLDTHLVRNSDGTFLMRVGGEALAGIGLHDGDLLVVDRTVPATTDSLVVTVQNGGFVLQRLGRDAQQRRVLHSAHPDWPDQLLENGSDPFIWGVARWAIHRLWPGRQPSSD